MCMVSVINDYGHLNVPAQTWTHQTWGEYQEIIRRLAELDKKLSQPDCDTKDKTEWQKDVEKRLAQLEKPQTPPMTTGSIAGFLGATSCNMAGCRGTCGICTPPKAKTPRSRKADTEFDNIIGQAKRIVGVSRSIASEAFPRGAILNCAKCRFAQRATTEDCARYLSTGWPSHCGATMSADAPAPDKRG